MRIMVALLAALICARLFLDLAPDLGRASEVGISVLSVVLIQGWMLQSLVAWATGDSASMRSTRAVDAAMVLRCGIEEG